MLLLITYDVNTENEAGKKRLRKVAKQCENYQAQSVTLKSLLTEIIDDKVDSLRFYYLGNNYKTKIEHIGVERGIAVDQPLFL